MTEPGYWRNETSGILIPVVYAYLTGDELTEHGIAIMRAYLRQWINAGVWQGGEEIQKLKSSVEQIRKLNDIVAWIDAAMDIGIDPL